MKNQFRESINADQCYTTSPEIVQLSYQVLAEKSISGDLRRENSKLKKGIQSKDEIIEKLKGQYHDLIVENEELAQQLE